MRNVVRVLPHVLSLHEQHVKIHENNYFTYIQMIIIQMLQNNMEKPYLVLVPKTV
jgi:hypothetical protein